MLELIISNINNILKTIKKRYILILSSFLLIFIYNLVSHNKILSKISFIDSFLIEPVNVSYLIDFYYLYSLVVSSVIIMYMFLSLPVIFSPKRIREKHFINHEETFIYLLKISILCLWYYAIPFLFFINIIMYYSNNCNLTDYSLIFVVGIFSLLLNFLALILFYFKGITIFDDID